MATLVIMAAGMGSRYGGSKQTEPVGPHNEILLEYTVYDAMQAGFNKAVFILREKMVEEFKQLYGDRIAKHMDVAYAVQDLNDLPQGFSVPDGRTKPWGTAHAVWCARKKVNEVFCAINADDFYGRDAFLKVFSFMQSMPESKPYACCMAGYRLKNTLTDNGTVSRGVCRADEGGMLTSIVELTQIRRTESGIADMKTGTSLNEEAPVSMNLWGFPRAVLDDLSQHLCTFLQNNPDPQKGEFYLPFYVDSLLKSGEASVRVLDTTTRWYGITYPEDRQAVANALKELTEQGVYPETLFP